VILWKKNIGNIWENMEHMENIIDIYIYMETSGDKYGNIF
jgi:ribulose-5-phosphate 4-epimerase/fuculose-1-phosphate aldolase